MGERDNVEKIRGKEREREIGAEKKGIERKIKDRLEVEKLKRVSERERERWGRQEREDIPMGSTKGQNPPGIRLCLTEKDGGKEY